MSEKKRIELKIKCQSCGGSGVFIGMAERDGIAVVCNTCKGTGCFNYAFEYEDFVERENKRGIKHILRTNPGICVGTEGKEGKEYKFEDFGGISYSEWKELKDPTNFPKNTEMRNFTCPKWWCQCAGKEYKNENCHFGGYFSDCKYFSSKELCWKDYDEKCEKCEKCKKEKKVK